MALCVAGREVERDGMVSSKPVKITGLARLAIDRAGA